MVLPAALATVALAASGCAGSHPASTPTTTSSRSTTTASASDPAIARVQASWPIMRVFPDIPGATGRCLLPGPGMSRGIRATCRTAVSTGAAGPEVVTFTETWPWKAFRLSGSPHRTQRHSWRFVVEGPRGRVILVGQHGDFPPQSAE